MKSCNLDYNDKTADCKRDNDRNGAIDVVDKEWIEHGDGWMAFMAATRLDSNKKVIHLLLSVCRALGALFANTPYKKQQHRYPMAQEKQ